MQNIGEEIVGQYLKMVCGCDFVEYNLTNPDIQGEIDVFGINIKERKVYICEVAIHLVTGLQYVKNNQPQNAVKLINKFSKDIEYVKKYFPDFQHTVMLWSPIVKDQKGTHNQLRDIQEILSKIKEKYQIEIVLKINQDFWKALTDLRKSAKEISAESKSPVIRFLQIEEQLKHHIELMQRRTDKN